MMHSSRGLVEAREVEAVLLPSLQFHEFIRAEGTGLLLDTMSTVPKTEAMGQGREEGLTRGGRVV